jgi:hypothetical protein
LADLERGIEPTAIHLKVIFSTSSSSKQITASGFPSVTFTLCYASKVDIGQSLIKGAHWPMPNGPPASADR